MAATIDCQETFVYGERWTIHEMREDGRMQVYTTDTRMKAKFDKLVAQEGSEWTLDRVDRSAVSKEPCCWYYSCPEYCVTFRAKKKTVNLTDEQRNELAERMRKTRDRSDET